MKYFSILFFIGSLFIAFDIKAQSDSVLLFTSEPAKFKGDYINFLQENLCYPRDAAKKKIEGEVLLQFVIEKDGTISNLEITVGVFPSLDKEAIRVIELSSGQWTPAYNNGVPARMRKKLAITFKISK